MPPARIPPSPPASYFFIVAVACLALGALLSAWALDLL